MEKVYKREDCERNRNPIRLHVGRVLGDRSEIYICRTNPSTYHCGRQVKDGRTLNKING